jgi:hypothetical protein
MVPLQMKKTDEKLDDLAVQVGHIESEFFSEDGAEVEVHDLLRSVNEVKTNYQHLPPVEADAGQI